MLKGKRVDFTFVLYGSPMRLQVVTTHRFGAMSDISLCVPGAPSGIELKRNLRSTRRETSAESCKMMRGTTQRQFMGVYKELG